MKRFRLWLEVATTLMLVALMVSTPGVAKAQSAEVLPELSQDWSVRVGLWIPQSQAARRAQGEVGISGLAERRVYKTLDYDINIGIGYNGFDRVYNIPVMGNIIWHKGNFRYGFGAGYAFGKRIDGRGISGAALGVNLGYQLTQTRNPLSLDLRYLFMSGADNELDGYSLTLGIRL